MLIRNKDHYKNPHGGLPIDPLILNAVQKRAERIIKNETLAIRSRLTKSLSDPRRDIDDECGFPKDPVDSRLYQELYNRDGIAQRVVRVMPRECWQTQPSVFESEDESTITDFEAVWDSLGKQIKGEPSWYKDEEGSAIWEVVRRADEWCGIGQYGIILLGFNDGITDLSQPVRGVVEENSMPVDLKAQWNESKKEFVSNNICYPNGDPHEKARNGKLQQYRLTTNKTIITHRKLTYMRVIPEYLAYVTQYEQNISSPRYGKPTMYTIRIVDDYSSYSGIGIPIVSLNVHWTRVIHLVDEITPGEIFGSPRCRAVLNYLLSLQKIYGGAAESYWKSAGPMLSFETHPQLGGDVSIDHDEFKDMIEQAMNSLQKYWTLMGMTVNTVAPPVNSPSEQIAAYIEAICINKEVPVRIFKGSERGELASTQDDDAWNDRLILRNYSHTSPRVISPLVDRLITTGVLPAPDRDKIVRKKTKSKIGRIFAHKGYGIFWPDLTSRSALEKAQIAEIKTNAAANYTGSELSNYITPVDYFTKFFDMDAEEVVTMLERAKKEQSEKEVTEEEDAEEGDIKEKEVKPTETDIALEGLESSEEQEGPTNQMDYSKHNKAYNSSSLYKKLMSLRGRIAQAAQEVYNEWEQDEDGIDEELGSGGICDEISRAIADIVLSSLDVEVTDDGQPGDDHAFPVFYNEEEAYGVDIPCNIYETGGGYRWKKIQGVTFDSSDVDIFKIDLPEDFIDNGEDEYGSWKTVGHVTNLINEEKIIVHAGKLVINNKGKKKKLNKPFRTPNGPKKFAVYVRKDNGNVVLVRFGDSNMEIKRDNPKRRKAFRDRHNCDNPGPKWKPKYWSCKMWSNKNVSDIVSNKKEYSYLCLSIENLPIKERKKLQELLSTISIDSKDIVKEKDGDYHITVLYGLHKDSPIDSYLALNHSGRVTVELGDISIFPATKDPYLGEYEVLKVTVKKTKSLIHLRNLAANNLEYTDLYPDYNPHITLAYVKKNTGKKYVGKWRGSGLVLSFDEITFSNTNESITKIPLE